MTVSDEGGRATPSRWSGKLTVTLLPAELHLPDRVKLSRPAHPDACHEVVCPWSRKRFESRVRLRRRV